MKLLHVISLVAPEAGGPTRVLADMVRYQKEKGLDVSVCVTDRGFPVTTILDKEMINTLLSEVEVQIFSVDFPTMLVSHAMARWLRNNLRTFDIVHVHGLYRFPPTYAAYQARKQGVPYIIRPYGSLDPYLYNKSSRSVLMKRIYEYLFDLPNLHAAGAIHYTTEDERQSAAFLGIRAPSFVVPNGLDWKYFARLPERGSFRVAHGFGETPLVLFLGRIHHVKGLDLLIPAFDRVLKQLPEARLAIVGPENDDYGKEIRGWVAKRTLNDKVLFIGHLEGEAVRQAFVDADVFVLPSYTENFGMTVVESMACGTPVVISDQVNINAEVTRAGAGLVTRCDVGEVAMALSTLLRDETRRQAMGVAGRRLVQECFTWPAIVDRLTNEYEQVIARTGRPIDQSLNA